MNNLGDDARNGTFCVSKAGLAIGDGAATGISIAAPNGAGVDFCINGLGYHLADSATNKPLTAAAVQAVSTTCLYLIQVDADGNVTSVKGTAVLTDDLTNGNKVLHWPTPAANKCAIGAVKVSTSDSVTFTAATTALSAGGITDVYYDIIGGVPLAGLTS
jgi:hypothetical protein